MYVYIYMYDICVCVYISPMVYMCVCIYPSLYLSVRPVCLSDIHPYLHLSIHWIHLLYLPTLSTFTLYIYSFYLSVCLSIHPSIHPSIYFTYLLFLPINTVSTVSSYWICLLYLSTASGIYLLYPSYLIIYLYNLPILIPSLQPVLSI